ncbi:PREDICTED: putative F-box/kelch-repeat protein At2g29820 [Camelina sativa]|uniref:F-box/kelch-repeat protein At2g29820 n=1 Tax=Camelina sativa TaxID=90675 RepID=A0ABM1QLB6_CAMSA|nr:PREDICTED: putative F-box/kelch-repeat protein At2g29820 [Camelina sativa]
MKRARYCAAPGVINGKIYVIGGRRKQDDDWVEVFDVDLEVWQTVPSQCPEDGSNDGWFDTYVVMQGKIFILDDFCCLAYEPREGLWQSWGYESELHRLWSSSLSSCVVGDLLFTLDLTCPLGLPIAVYNPNEMVWKPLLTVYMYSFTWFGGSPVWSMANLGGKLEVLGDFFRGSTDIVCVEITFETREEGHLWGNVESTTAVYTDDHKETMFPIVKLCQTVTV